MQDCFLVTGVLHFLSSGVFWLVLGYFLSFLVAVLIISENRNPSKTLAYLLLLFMLPYISVVIYFLLGENYRKKKLYQRKWFSDRSNLKKFEQLVEQITRDALVQYSHRMGSFVPLARLLLRESRAPLTAANSVRLLSNGGEKFSAVESIIQQARHHIHLEYYILEEGILMERLSELLKKKAQSGVLVRIIYDDFGSKLSKSLLKEWKEAGIEAVPFYKILIPVLSNRHNYRNHRKLIVVDGQWGFVGGMNYSDRYHNDLGLDQVFWRDTHLMLEGDVVKMLQVLFLINWNFCTDAELPLEQSYFPDLPEERSSTWLKSPHSTPAQIAFSGPDSDRATIMLSYAQAIALSRKSIFISTPYFIPNETILNALKAAAFSGVEVILLVPGISDSSIVNAAARSYYEELLEAGVKIFLYKKGFLHAKTMVCDSVLSMVGSANFDIRSFDLNFELNAVLYDQDLASALEDSFLEDLSKSEQLQLENWKNRPLIQKWSESFCRLFSSLM